MAESSDGEAESGFGGCEAEAHGIRADLSLGCGGKRSEERDEMHGLGIAFGGSVEPSLTGSGEHASPFAGIRLVAVASANGIGLRLTALTLFLAGLVLRFLGRTIPLLVGGTLGLWMPPGSDDWLSSEGVPELAGGEKKTVSLSLSNDALCFRILPLLVDLIGQETVQFDQNTGLLDGEQFLHHLRDTSGRNFEHSRQLHTMWLHESHPSLLGNQCEK